LGGKGKERLARRSFSLYFLREIRKKKGRGERSFAVNASSNQFGGEDTQKSFFSGKQREEEKGLKGGF